jgi:hypothetical protein
VPLPLTRTSAERPHRAYLRDLRVGISCWLKASCLGWHPTPTTARDAGHQLPTYLGTVHTTSTGHLCEVCTRQYPPTHILHHRHPIPTPLGTQGADALTVPDSIQPWPAAIARYTGETGIQTRPSTGMCKGQSSTPPSPHSGLIHLPVASGPGFPRP